MEKKTYTAPASGTIIINSTRHLLDWSATKALRGNNTPEARLANMWDDDDEFDDDFDDGEEDDW